MPNEIAKGSRWVLLTPCNSHDAVEVLAVESDEIGRWVDFRTAGGAIYQWRADRFLEHYRPEET